MDRKSKDCEVDGMCPFCIEGVGFDRFENDFPCPHCGKMLATEHECGEDGCGDWLVVP